MQILVMGGSYFLGWHLVKALSKLDVEVFVFNRGTKSRYYPKNTIHLLGDRDNPSDVKRLLSSQRYDAVFDISATTPSRTALMIEVLSGKVEHFIHISTSAVYQQTDVFPVRETFPIGKHPVWGRYGVLKAECDKMLINAHHRDVFPVTIIRPSYIYGPDNYKNIETFFFERLSQKRTVLIPSCGHSIVQMGHVLDLVDGLLLLLRNSNAKGEVFNMSSSECITFLGLCRLYSAIMGEELSYRLVNIANFGLKEKEIFPFYDGTLFTDVTKAQTLLGYRTQRELKDELHRDYKLWIQETVPTSRDRSYFDLEDSILKRL